MATDELSAEEIHKLKQFSHALPDEQDKLDQLKNVDIDAIVDATGVSRRNVLQVILGLAAGGVVGGLSANEIVQAVEADASTTDGDGNVGLPGDRVDMYADGIDSNVVSTESATINNSVTFPDGTTVTTSPGGGDTTLQDWALVNHYDPMPSGDPGDWTEISNNPILTGDGGKWDETINSPTELLKIGGTYYLFYTGRDSSGVNRIGLATTTTPTDASSWSKSANNPILSPGSGGSWDEDDVLNPTIVRDSGAWNMYYRGTDSSGNQQIGIAVSNESTPDTTNWSKSGSNPVLSTGSGWESDSVAAPNAVKVGETIYLYYEGDDGTTTQIGYATTQDRTTFSKAGANPVLEVGSGWESDDVAAPALARVGNTWLMMYMGDTSGDHNIGLAVSDSINADSWTKADDNPVYQDTNPFRPSILRDGSVYYMAVEDEQSDVVDLITLDITPP